MDRNRIPLGLSTTDLLMTPAGRPITSYSQNAEDVRLWRVLHDRTPGFYVDVGAGHPTSGSVTRLFYEHGWTGINVEPGPTFPALEKERLRDVNLRVAVGPEDGETELFVTHPDPHLSSVDPEALRWSGDRIERVDAVRVGQRRLASILAAHATGRRIDFLKVDVEGAERAVLESSDWQRFRPTIVVVEAVRPWSRVPSHEEWEEVLTRSGYHPAAFDGINRFYVSEENLTLAGELAYPVSPLDGYVPLGERQAIERLSKLQGEMKALQEEAAAAKARARAAEARLRAVLASRAWRVAETIRRVTRPVRIVLRPGARRRPGGGGAGPHEGRHSNRGSRRSRVPDIYRAAIAPGRPFAFPPARTTTPDGSLTQIRELLTGPSAGTVRTRVALDAAIEATARHEEPVLADRRLSWDARAAIVQAEIVGVLQAAPHPTTEATVRPGGGSALIVDVRNLQDPDARRRGMGRHAEQVLRAAAAMCDAATDLTLLVDPALPTLDADLAALGASTIVSVDPTQLDRVELFVELAPLIGSIGPAVPLLMAPEVPCVAVVYEPLSAEPPSNESESDAAMIRHMARLEALRRYDSFVAVSEASAEALRRMLGRDLPVAVTGLGGPPAEVGPGSHRGSLPFPRYVLVATDRTGRKNVLAAIAAHALGAGGKGSALGLAIVGRLPPTLLAEARAFASDCGVSDGDIAFWSDPTDGQLRSLYQAAEVVAAPSFAASFACSIVASIAAGTPVVASDIEAHRRLLGDGWWLVPPDDPVALERAVSRAVSERGALLERQREALGNRFDADDVAARMRSALSSALRRHTTPANGRASGGTRKKPARIAIFTPLPPQRTGVGEYTAAALPALATYADLVVCTDRGAARVPHPGITFQEYSLRPHLDRDFDAVISVLGNSHFHIPALEYFLEFGGACIAHDPWMAGLWNFWRGSEHLAAMLSRHAGRPIIRADISQMLADPDRLPAAAYDEIAPRGRPMLVHSTGIARRILDETGVRSIVLPYVPHRVPGTDALDQFVADEAREALGWSKDELHVATFGIVHRRSKAIDVLIDAVGQLHGRGVKCHVHFVGPASPAELDDALQRTEALGLTRYTHATGWVPADALERYLLGVDAAVQVRTYSVAPLSGALLDCMAFGVPTVSTTSLCSEMHAPDSVRVVPDRFDATDLADALGIILERGRGEAVTSIEPERRAWLAERSADAYARRLLEALNLDGRS